MIVQKGYMSIVVVTHHNVQPAMQCHGSPIAANAISKVEVFQAGFDSETKLPVKQEKLLECYMSDAQFGMLITTPGVEPGQAVTLTNFLGKRIDMSLLQNSNNELQAAINKALNVDPVVIKMIDSYIEKVKSIREGGRVPATAWRELKMDINRLKYQASDLELQHALNTVHEKAHEQSMAWLQNFQSFLRNGATAIGLPAPSESAESAVPPFGRAIIHFTSGSQTLFADSDCDGRSVSLSFSEDKGRAGCVCSPMLKIRLSPMQFARLLRSSGEEIPCTLERLNHKAILMAEPVSLEYSDHIEDTFCSSSNFEHITSAFTSALKSLDAHFEKTPNKATLDAVLGKLSELHSAYANMKAGLHDVNLDAIERILKDKHDATTHYAKNSSKALPVTQQQALLVLLDTLKQK